MTKSELNAFKKQWATAAQSKTLLASHHVMYNLLRGYDQQRGFTPITNHNRLQNGAAINYGIAEATRRLANIVRMANRYEGYNVSWVDRFLAPFGGALTVEHLATLQVPAIADVESNFGIGKKIAASIVENNLTCLTFDDITAMSVDLAA